MSDTIYAGKGKKMKENWIKATLKPDVLMQNIKTHKGHEYIPVNININEKPDKYGKDVSISIDTWEPKNTPQQKNDEVGVEDVPF
jgi:hypothetical protein